MLIILDRDGVINHDSPNYIKSPDEWHAIDGSMKAIADLCKMDHTVVVATNQSGVGRGYYSEDTLAAIHQKMIDAVEAKGGHIKHIYYCPHKPDDHCECRKPKSGLFLQIAQDFNTDLSDAVLVGDHIRDIEAAAGAGCKGVFVRTGNGEKYCQQANDIPVYDDLADFVKRYSFS